MYKEKIGIDAKRHGGIVDSVEKDFGGVCQNCPVMLNLIQHLSMLIEGVKFLAKDNTPLPAFLTLVHTRVRTASSRSRGEDRDSFNDFGKITPNTLPVKNLLPYSPIPLLPSKRVAFTLAEVLITLGIIGVVAAITLSSVINKIQDRQNIVKWKKAYSVVNNAFNKVMADNIPICEYRGPNTCTDDGASILYTAEFIEAMKKELNVIAVCGSISERRNPLGFPKCKFDGDKYWNGFSGNDTRSKYGSLAQKPAKLGDKGSINDYDFCNFAFLLADGTALNFGGLWSGLTIGVDVNNATKGPNQLGKDFFTIQIITKNYGQTNYLKPMGADGTTGQNNNAYGSSGCSADIGLASANAVVWAAGAGCAAKYLME